MVLSDENILIEETLNGDINSFELIVRNYNLMVYTLAYRVLKNHEEAEELTQDVFLKIYQSLGSFNRKSKLSTWIYRITYNTSINKYKSQKRKINEIEINNSIELNISNSSDTDYDINFKEKREIINASLLKLPETEKVIVTLYYYEELPIKEIAEIIGITPQNVKIKLYRSRKKLYNDLKDKMGQQKINDYEYN